jgi:hypothetical protein
MSSIKVDAEKLKAIQSAECDTERKAAYVKEADPLFFKSQRGEVPMQAWLDKISEIKLRYPKP